MGLFNRKRRPDPNTTEADLARAAREMKPGCHPASYREFARNAYADGRTAEDVENSLWFWEARDCD